ncbi:hypothetical protein IW140_001489 [Coemansia sp. RSA 1813]|nr:hypothetical protein EV178_003273 [Coemansia sp. RSA 1646]KAJ1771561.1 hypothetical protein LPJ74_002249 [Coemansia sp. RSA 1843]KAJ2089579.1 hypothetical protein IW138_003321 [Coemansia sp. RSA 986]KAJ2214681.1 hypothetical protein EV179_002786 [Coemansia sp. RSA 487]KAJ2571571.1 hypothetical protein IW140_001489 [Coemansia sp. RSA 1813]
MGFMMTESTVTSKRVAVVGSGLAGLTTAHFLQKSGYAVELFEKSRSVGMDMGSLTIEGVRVDVPFRVFTPDYYPYLYRMYRYLGIDFAAADYSLGFTRDNSDTSVWSYTNLPFEDFQMPIPDGIGCAERVTITREWVRLAFACLKLMRMPDHGLLQGSSQNMGSITIGQYLQQGRYERAFVDQVFIPFIASLLTCSLEAAAAYPANTILHFTTKVLFGSRIRKAKNGIQEVCDILTRGLSSVHLGTSIKEMIPCDAGTGAKSNQVCLVSGDGERRYFDEVVLATPADVAALLLSTGNKEESKYGSAEYPPNELIKALQSVPYEDTYVVTHRDKAVMPTNRDEWRGVNIRTTAGGSNAMASHWINYVEQTTSGCKFSTQVFQTVDPLVALDKAKIISTTRFHRSLVTVESQRQINTVHTHQGKCGIWFVGTYTSPGVPLLEGCVRTSVDVVRAMGGHIPFDAPQLARKRGGVSYEIGLAPGMVRDEVVEAYFENDIAATFKFSRPWQCRQPDRKGEDGNVAAGIQDSSSPSSSSSAGMSKRQSIWQWAGWLGFAVVLPMLSITFAVLNVVLSAALGPSLASRVQMAALDFLVYVGCVLQLGYMQLLRFGVLRR